MRTQKIDIIIDNVGYGMNLETDKEPQDIIAIMHTALMKAIPLDAVVIHAYDFEIYGNTGEIMAENMHQALYKVIDIYFRLPYPSQEHVRVDIKCKKRV